MGKASLDAVTLPEEESGFTQNNEVLPNIQTKIWTEVSISLCWEQGKGCINS
jgi:hypothetical protein